MGPTLPTSGEAQCAFNLRGKAARNVSIACNNAQVPRKTCTAKLLSAEKELAPVGMASPSKGKLQRAVAPRMARAALSYARAASSAVSKVPSHLSCADSLSQIVDALQHCNNVNPLC